MPLPKPNKGEEREAFIARCMGANVTNTDFPDNSQRAAVCYNQWKEKDNVDKIEFIANISKLDEAQRLVFGWFSVIEENGEVVKDLQGDMISEAELEKAAYDFVLNARVGGEMHVRKGVGRLVESIMFTKEKQKALGIDLKKVGWWGGFKVDDEDVWEGVRSGKYVAFSIGGKGKRAEAN